MRRRQGPRLAKERVAGRHSRPLLLLVLLALGVAGNFSFGAGEDVLRINGDHAKLLLGDGTGVVIGILDSGVDSTHPALAGFTSTGQPRLFGVRDFATLTDGDDVYGHGTRVAGVALMRDAGYIAVATDAQFLNVKVLGNTGIASSNRIMNGVGYAAHNGADIINLSLNLNGLNSSGDDIISKVVDYAGSQQGSLVVVSVGNYGQEAGREAPSVPATAFNAISVGASAGPNYNQVVPFSSYGLTLDGRSKPEIVAPGEAVLTTAHDWETGEDFVLMGGTSAAAPNVAAILAAQMEYGMTHGLSTDPRVLKATLLNSAEKINDRNNGAWEPGQSSALPGGYATTRPLDTDSGAGQVDGLALYHQYSAGPQGPGSVLNVGWDFSNIESTAFLEYHLGQLAGGSLLAATLTWHREVGWTDTNANGLTDSSDAYPLLSLMENLDLSIYRSGLLVGLSNSAVDNVEHLYLTGIEEGDYTIRVSYMSGDGPTDFGLAWSGTAIPEPSSAALVVFSAVLWHAGRRRRQSHR